ncbi:hypothetical protein NFA_43020 [Nocardia farcinica IFM 10152]|uniref:Uncharacterized protein n=1 Tax=Nocardia farcinica (strain IFM 10152) TaxID=247156 RepID=Q5YRP0_NOCFA|nr:hypothetical protein NFA_43020 [Nocardia farcinica IFM 10152]
MTLVDSFPLAVLDVHHMHPWTHVGTSLAVDRYGQAGVFRHGSAGTTRSPARTIIRSSTAMRLRCASTSCSAAFTVSSVRPAVPSSAPTIASAASSTSIVTRAITHLHSTPYAKW